MTTDLHRRSESADHIGTAAPGARRLDRHTRPVPPVVIDGRVLIDGGATNPMPFDKLNGLADRVVAVDVYGIPEVDRVDIPNSWETVYATAMVMGGAIIAAKLEHAAPDLLIRPNVSIFRTLGFLQASAIIRAAEAVKTEVKERLGALLALSVSAAP